MSWSTLNSLFQWLPWCFLTRKPLPHSARATPAEKAATNVKIITGQDGDLTSLPCIHGSDLENPTEGLTCLHISISVGFKFPKMTSAFYGDKKSSFWSPPINIQWQDFKFLLDIDTMFSRLVNEINAFHDELKVSSLLQLGNRRLDEVQDPFWNSLTTLGTVYCGWSPTIVPSQPIPPPPVLQRSLLHPDRSPIPLRIPKMQIQCIKSPLTQKIGWEWDSIKKMVPTVHLQVGSSHCDCQLCEGKT